MTKKTYEYEVRGMFEFPSDMLRYDRAKIISTREYRGRTIYKLRGATPPTEGRWHSFGWVVSQPRFPDA